jgi:hypothetical protein
MFVVVEENQYRSSNPFIAAYASDDLFRRVDQAIQELVVGAADKINTELKGKDKRRLNAFLLMTIFENAALLDHDLSEYFKSQKSVAEIYPIIQRMPDIAGLGVSLGRLVIHLVAIMYLRGERMGLFWNLYSSPSKLHRTYIPTMHEGK